MKLADRGCARRIGFGLGVVLMLAGMAGVSPARAESPFTPLAGTWVGGGNIKLSGGQSERLSCRAYYTAKEGGNELGIAIRCASPSYKIELRSTLHHAGERVTGSWEERTFNASGDVTGKASGGAITISFSGNVSGTMSVTTTGASQKVAITTTGSDLSAVSLSLSKEG